MICFLILNLLWAISPTGEAIHLLSNKHLVVLCWFGLIFPTKIFSLSSSSQTSALLIVLSKGKRCVARFHNKSQKQIIFWISSTVSPNESCREEQSPKSLSIEFIQHLSLFLSMFPLLCVFSMQQSRSRTVEILMTFNQNKDPLDVQFKLHYFQIVYYSFKCLNPWQMNKF